MSRYVNEIVSLRAPGERMPAKVMPPESVTQQSFKEEVDVNTIVRRFGMNAGIPKGVAEGVYGDFTGISSYEDAVAQIDRAHSGFMRLPPEVRERFANDPGRLVQFAGSASLEEFKAVFDAPPVAPAAAPVVAPAVEPA